MSQQKTNPHSLPLPILQLPTDQPRERQRGRGHIRALVLVLVHLLILAHILHYWIYEKSISPLEPSDSVYTIELGQVNAGAIFFALTILSTMVFGRFFCGWGCHLVALQDLSGYLLRRMGLRPKPLRSRLLAWVPFVIAFDMFFWPTLQRLWRGDPHPGFSNHLVTQNFWYYFPGPVVSIVTFLVCGGLIIYLLGNKGFCTYACPYGAFFSVADRMALGRIRVTDACHQCGQCTAHCTSNVQVHAEVRDYGMVINSGCMKCMDCVSVCPNHALYYGLTERPGSRSKTAAESRESAIDLQPTARSNKNYDYTLWEDILALAIVALTVYSLRGLYDIPPLLLSVAIGVMTAYWAIQTCRSFKKVDQQIQNIQLKRSGRFTTPGRFSVALLALWMLFIGHSFCIQLSRHYGKHYLSQVPAAWSSLFDSTAQPYFTDQDLANAEKSIQAYQFTDKLGFMSFLDVKLNLAKGYLIKNDLKEAERHLRKAYEIAPEAVRDLLLEFLVAQDREDDAALVR